MPENGRIRNRSDRILAGRFHDFRKYWSIDTESSHFYGMHLHLQNFAFLYPTFRMWASDIKFKGRHTKIVIRVKFDREIIISRK